MIDLKVYKPGVISVRRLCDNQFGLIYITHDNDNCVHEIVYMRRVDNSSLWSVDDDGLVYIVDLIEHMVPRERNQFEASHSEFRFMGHVDNSMLKNHVLEYPKFFYQKPK